MWWLGAVRHQAITWANVDTIQCPHITSLGPNKLNQMFYWERITAYRVNCQLVVTFQQKHPLLSCYVANNHGTGYVDEWVPIFHGEWLQLPARSYCWEMNKIMEIYSIFWNEFNSTTVKRLASIFVLDSYT